MKFLPQSGSLPSCRTIVRVVAHLLLLFSFPCAGQSSPTGLSVRGTVTDPSSAALANARVALLDPDGKEIRRTQSDSAGNFHFDGLGVGAYKIRIERSGFNSLVQAIQVNDHQVWNVTLRMTIAVSSEQVTVLGGNSAPVISTDEDANQSVNAADRTTLDQIPVFDQDFITTMSRFLDPNSIGTSGVSLVVNGVEANGPGVTNSAIKEVKINNNPYSPLFAKPGRARIEITTESGTPEFHGSLNLMFRDSIFDAAQAFAPVKASEQRRYYEGSLTGPLGRDKKNTFLLSIDRDEQDDEAVVLADGLNGPINANVSTQIRHFFASGRAFHDFGNGDQAWIGYSYEQRSATNQGVGGIVLPSAATDTAMQEHEVNVGYTKVISPKMINNLHFLVGYNNAPTSSISADPKVVVSGAFTSGGAQANFRRTESHFDGTDIVTYASGRQVMKFGIDVPDISRRGFDDFTNRAGSYYFTDLAAYADRAPSTYIVQQGNGHVAFLEKVVSGVFEDAIQVRPNLSVTLGVRYYWQNYFHDVPHNVAPRASFAYAPGRARRFILRGGGGMFFDRTGPTPIADLLHFSGDGLHRYILDNPVYPVDPATLSGSPQSLVTLDPLSRMPYTVLYNLGVETQLSKKSTLAANYVGSRGIDLFRSRDTNAPFPPDYEIRPETALGQVRQIEPDGYQKSNGLEVTFRGHATEYFTGQAQYTLSKTYNNTNGINYFPANSYLPNADWARSDNDRRHRFDLLGVFEAKNYFHLGVGLSLYSGLPINVTTGSDNNQDGVVNDRPAGFSRNSLHGPGYADFDLTLSHDFVLRRDNKNSPRLKVALNGFNVLNQTNDLTYVGVLGSPFFGQPVSAQPPRRIQLNVQLSY
jgi:hypothetical protein